MTRLHKYTKNSYIGHLHESLSLGFTIAVFGSLLLTGPAAEGILKNVDLTVSPCDNFYQYACGNYIKTDDGAGDSLYPVNVDSIIIPRINKQLNDSINADNNNEKKVYKLVRNLYKSCMNTSKIDEIGIKDLNNKIKSIGGWPVVEGENWNEANFNWTDVMKRLIELGFAANYFIKFDVTEDIYGENYVIQLSPPESTYIHDEINQLGAITKYYTYAKNVAMEFGAEENLANYEMAHVVNLEWSLKKPEFDGYEKTNVLQLSIAYRHIPWINYIKNYLPASQVVDDNTVVLLQYPKYFKQLNSVLESASKRTIANYIWWKMIRGSISYLNKKMQNDFLAMKSAITNKTISTTESQHERSEYCIDITKSLNTAINSVYVRDHFNPETKNEVIEMVKHLKDELTQMFKKNYWLDAQTKQQHMQKLANLSCLVAYPEELLDDKILGEYYNGFEMSEDLFFENILKIHKFYANKRNEKWNQPHRKDDWNEMDTMSTLAEYFVYDNSVYIPAGIIQDITFNKNRPMYANYGALGTIISQKMANAFNSVGCTLNNTGWEISVTDEMLEFNFNRSNCIIDVYFQYPVMDFWQSPPRVENQNVADVLGVLLAYKTYLKRVENQEQEEKLPGIKEDPKQLFWLSYASINCEKLTTSHFIYYYAESSEPTCEMKIFGSLKANPEFAKDYKCKNDSKMYLPRPERCDMLPKKLNKKKLVAAF